MLRAFTVIIGTLLAACSVDPSEVELRRQAAIAYWLERAVLFIGDPRDGSIRAISMRNHTPVVLWQRRLAGTTGALRLEMDTRQQRLLVRNGRKVFFQNPENGDAQER